MVFRVAPLQLGASLAKSEWAWHGVLGPLSYKLKLIAEKIDRPEDRDLKLRIQHACGPLARRIYIISIGRYISIACHYRRIFVQCLSLSAYICPIPVTIGVYLSNACHYQPIFVQCLSEITENVIIPYVFNDLELIPGTLRHPPDLGEVSHLLQFGTSSTRAGGQDDVNSNQLPQQNTVEFKFTP